MNNLIDTTNQEYEEFANETDPVKRFQNHAMMQARIEHNIRAFGGTRAARQDAEMLLDPPLETRVERSYTVTCKLCSVEVVKQEGCLTTANELAYDHLRIVHKGCP